MAQFLVKLLLLTTATLTLHVLPFQAADTSCLPSDVLWLWSGALTSRSITFKFGLREGYTCVDSDFVLYAFPELLEGEKRHSVITNCSSVDGGETGDGEVRSLSSYDAPNVKQCIFSDLPHSDRKYQYELRLLTNDEIVRKGSFTTPRTEGTSFNYRVVFGSCADENSDPEIFHEIKNKNPFLFLHIGDLHYHNIKVNAVAAFRNSYNSIFASPAGQAMLAMDVPFVYMWDDHDFGPDNSDSTAPGRNASVQAYHEMVPHYPFGGGRSRSNTVHQAFTIGRVRYLLTDLRSGRTPNTAPAAPTKTVLGKKQKNWFKNELLQATNDPTIRLIVWVNTMPWLDDERKWGHFVHEQQELVNFIKGHGLNKWVPIVIVSGDAHMLAVDDGSNSPGNMTVLHAAALGRPGSIKGGPYSHGAFPGSGQYAVLDVTDDGEKEGSVCLYYRGMNIYKGQLIEFDTCHPENTPPVTPYHPPPIPVRVLLRMFKKIKKYKVTATIVVMTFFAIFVKRIRRFQATESKKRT
ncbi:mitogen-activated protein kinase [Plasmopara halstedii]|uniref:Mitogen-activated protein kinase n=1 Tax=Plasmopara halstedii TaxID=4781 RepID=A0A0P1B4N3_PLAHL|nr:mitogen-activated protein kinase [Plasmopara halstedii]CEG49340.1 mitogen-activated protein kinase [Plasmopara halstedii]|eukprot:XP_024585709.1 mitogen-activated protein kinase [Plasmopara halstedii]